MRITKKFQVGGALPEEQAAAAPAVEQAPDATGAAPAQEQDPLMMILQLAAQALEGQDCESAMGVCDALIQLASQGQEESQAQPQQEPLYKRGGVLVMKD